MLYPLASLEAEKLNAIQQLEATIGGPVLALKEVDTSTADLPQEQLRELQELEAKLGIVLVAVRPS